MHMADALLAPAVAATMYVASGAAVGVSVHQLKKDENTQKLPTMAVSAALVFAGQMIPQQGGPASASPLTAEGRINDPPAQVAVAAAASGSQAVAQQFDVAAAPNGIGDRISQFAFLHGLCLLYACTYCFCLSYTRRGTECKTIELEKKS